MKAAMMANERVFTDYTRYFLLESGAEKTEYCFVILLDRCSSVSPTFLDMTVYRQKLGAPQTISATECSLLLPSNAQELHTS